MRQIFFCVLFLLFLPCLIFSQANIWKSYYAKSAYYNIVDDGNYLHYVNGNQLVQFDKNSGYFVYDKLPGNVLPCNSLHSSYQVSARDLAKDKNGNIWLLTSNSINRFDGTTWMVWDSSFFNNAMSFSSVFDLMIDRNNIVWLTSSTHGIIRFDGISYSVFDTLNSSLPSYNFYARMTEDTAGNIWFCDIDTGIVKFDGNNFTYYNNATIGISNGGGTYIYGIFINPVTNDVFGQSGSDGYYYHFNGSSWQKMSLDTLLVGTNNFANYIFFDATGNTYFSVAKGIVKFDGNSYSLLTNFPNYNTDNNYVSDAKTDANGIVWLVLNQQLVRFDGQNFITYNDPRAVLQSNVMLPQMIDNDKNHWMGYWGGGGLTKEVGNAFITIPQATDPIYCMTMDSAKRLWFGTGNWNPLHYYYNDTIITAGQNPLANSYFSSVDGLTIDRNNTVWLVGNAAGAGRGFAMVDHDTISVQPFMYLNGDAALSCISADSTNNIWIGTIQGWGNPGQGLVKYNNGNFTLYNQSNSGLPDNEIQTIAVDSLNRIWVGTANGGLAIFDGTTWVVYNTSNSPIPGNHVEWITFKNGKAYIATMMHGFAIFDGTFWEIFNPDNSPLVNDDCESIVVDDHCNVWVATECGLSEIVGTCGGGTLKMLYGTVTDENNTPVTGTEVFLMKYDGALSALKPIDDIKTDINGQFSFATEETQLYVHAVPDKNFYPLLMPGYEDTSLVQQNAPPIQMNSAAIQKNIKCASAQPISTNTSFTGFVSKDNGQKASGVRLFLMQNNKPVATTIIGINGNFSFSNLASGTYSVWVDKMSINNLVAPVVTLSQYDGYATMMLHDTWLELLTTSVQEIKNDFSLKVFPNPTKDKISFFLPAETGANATLEITDFQGRKILSKSIPTGSNDFDVSMLDNGVYLIRVITGSDKAQQKLVIQK